MIPASSAYISASQSLALEPVFIIRIAGYKRAFSNVAFSSPVPGLPFAPPIIQQAQLLNDFGGLESFPGGVELPGTVTAGDQLFAFMYYADGGTSAAISNDPVSTVKPSWTLLYDSGLVAIWGAVAPASGTVFVQFGTGANRANSEFYVVEMSSQFTDYSSSSNGDSFTITFQEASTSAEAVEFTFLVPGSPSVLDGAIILFTGAATALIAASPGPIDVFDWLVAMGDLTLDVALLDGGQDFQGWTFNVQDRDGAITGDFPFIVLEGKELVLSHGFRGMAFDDFLTLDTQRVDTISSDNSNTEYNFSMVDVLQNDLARSIYTLGDDGYPTDSDHPRTLNGHPLDMLLAGLRTELGFADTRIGVANIQGLRDGLFAGVQELFVLTSPPAAKDFFQSEICRPLGLYLSRNAFGVVTVVSMYPQSLTPVATLDSDTLTEIPQEEQAELVNQVDVKFDYAEGEDKPLMDVLSTYKTSRNRYGAGPLHTIEAHGLRSGFQGVLLAEFVSRLIFSRFGLKNAMFEDSSSLLNIWSTCRLENGDLVGLTCPFTPDREAGVIGFTDRLFEIVSRTHHLSDFSLRVGFTLLRVDFPRFTQYLIAPDGEGDFTAVGSAEKTSYLFLSNDSGRYSDSTPANTLC